MTSSSIHLIGTIHYDLNGTRRLERALRTEKPDILTIESSQAWLDSLAKNHNGDLENCLQITKNKEFSQETKIFFETYLRSYSNYEVDVCQSYAASKKIPLYFIDDPTNVDLLRQEIQSQLNLFFDEMNPRLLDGVSQKSVMRSHDRIYDFIQKLYDGNIPSIIGEQIIDTHRGKLIGKRDKTEAAQITEIVALHDARIVHVGGFMHALSDSKGDTLYSRLARFNRSRKTLKFYDK